MNSSMDSSNNKGANSGSTIMASSNLAVTSDFLKREIAIIIKEELKTYHLRNKLQAQLKEHQEKQINKQLSRMVFSDKMANFKDKEKASGRKKYDQFQKRQQAREQRLRLFMKHKHQNHQDKFFTINEAIENVRERHQHLTQEDSRQRLEKLGIMTACNSRTSQGSRALSTSYSSNQKNMASQLNHQRETNLVTNYLTKIERSESRVLLRDLQNYKRSQTSKKSRVKCLVDQRNREEVDKMARVQKQYRVRMDHFQVIRSKVQHQKETVLAHRSHINSTNFKKAAQRREFMKSKQNIDLNQGSISMASPNEKQSILKRYKSALDLVNDQRNMRENLKKMKEEANRNQLDNTFKILTEKLQKIRNLKYGEKLDERSIKTVLSLIDKKDPEFAGLAEFLHLERKSFLQAWVKREEERSKFDKKLNKAAALM